MFAPWLDRCRPLPWLSQVVLLAEGGRSPVPIAVHKAESWRDTTPQPLPDLRLAFPYAAGPPTSLVENMPQACLSTGMTEWTQGRSPVLHRAVECEGVRDIIAQR